MRTLLTATLLLAAAPAAAEVKSVTANGFEVAHTATVAAPPEALFALLGRPAEWWDPAHSYSQKPANLSLALKAGGCFCETLDGGGSVEHMRVVMVMPGKVLRLRGGLGPLQGDGVEGALTWTLKAVPGGTALTITYVVGGYMRMGMDKIVPGVDGVLGQQVQRLKAAAERPAK